MKNTTFLIIRQKGKSKNYLYDKPIILGSYDNYDKAKEVLDTLAKDLLNNGLVLIQETLDNEYKRLSKIMANNDTRLRYNIYKINEETPYIEEKYYLYDIYELIQL